MNDNIITLSVSKMFSLPHAMFTVIIFGHCNTHQKLSIEIDEIAYYILVAVLHLLNRFTKIDALELRKSKIDVLLIAFVDATPNYIAAISG